MTVRRVGGLALVAGFTVAGPASAQTGPGYPGTTSTRPPAPTSDVQSAGQVRPGESIVIESCGFQPAAALEVAFNGSGAGGDLADASGCGHVTFRVLEDCPDVEVNGQRRTAQRGRNEVVATGTGVNTAPRDVTTNVTVSCSTGGGGKPNKGRGPGAGDAGASTAGDRSTDDGVLAVATIPESAGGRLAALGVLLLLIDVAIVVWNRRRRRRRAAL